MEIEYVIEIRVRGDYPGDLDKLARQMQELVHHPSSYDWREEKRPEGRTRGMSKEKLRELVAEADALEEENPGFAEGPGVDQPSGDYVTRATDLLNRLDGDEKAPWYQVFVVAHALTRTWGAIRTTEQGSGRGRTPSPMTSMW